MRRACNNYWVGFDSIAVIGGGPAGAMAAAQLAAAGRKVVLIDEKLAWEKPCGGGLTHKALERYPFLAEAEVERNWVRGCEHGGARSQQLLLSWLRARATPSASLPRWRLPT